MILVESSRGSPCSVYPVKRIVQRILNILESLMQITKKDSTSMGFMGTLSVNMYEKYRRVNKRKSGAFLNGTEEQRASISRVEICAFHC